MTGVFPPVGGQKGAIEVKAGVLGPLVSRLGPTMRRFDNLASFVPYLREALQ